MGWWWGADPQKPVLQKSDPVPDPVPTPSEPPASPRELADGPNPLPSTDRELEQELEKFLSPRKAGDTEHERSSIAQRARASFLGIPAGPAPAEDTRSDDGDRVASAEDNGPTSIFPETMSCRDAFDRAFYCNSLGGQIRNVYQYGSTRDCKPNWSEFWFCMKLRTHSEESKREKIRDWYIRREAEVKLGPSSEDVWTVRKEKLERAFDMDPDTAAHLERRVGR